MNKKTKKIIIAVALIVALGLGGGFGFAAVPKNGKVSEERWSDENAFSVESDVEKVFDINESKHTDENGEHEFVVLNLADVQLNGLKFSSWKPTFTMLTNLINTVNPDLITLTGDQVSGAYTYTALKKICSFIDEFGIPWCPVMGNHDGESDMDWNKNGDIYLSCKNCVFKKNDPALGMGNYVLAVKNGNEYIHSIFMMDSHSDMSDRIKGGEGYDYIWAPQLTWYKWNVNGLKTANNGKTVPSSCFFHIPLVEYKEAYKLYEDGTLAGYGSKRENICASDYNNGFFGLMQELGSTKLVVVGHDHTNNFAVTYEGITLAYGLKSGYGSYWDEDKIGGTTITINQKGETELAYYYNVDGEIVRK